MNKDTLILITFVIYLIGMAFIGYVAYKRTKNSADYFLGGRSLGPIVAALSACASDMSGWLLFALPGMAYTIGVGALWNVLGLLVGTYLNWLILAKRLRVFSSVANDALTIPSFLAVRFHDEKGWIRRFSAIFILVFFLIYTSSGLVASAKLFASVFSMNYHVAVCLGALAIVSYTLFGGFLAVSWTDVVQGLLMSLALAIVPVAAIYSCGGISAVYEGMHLKNPALLDIFRIDPHQSINGIMIFSLLAWGLGYFGQPHILARFKAIDSVDHLPRARKIAMLWTFFSIGGAAAAGFAGICFFNQPLIDHEKVYVALVDALFHPAIAGILLAAILAAIMSTADSQLLVASSALAEDIYKNWLGKSPSEKQVMTVGRLAVLGVTLSAIFIALDPQNEVLDLAAYAWAGLGSTFGPVLLCSLFWRKMSARGALFGLLCGSLTVLIWHNIEGGIFELYEMVPGFAASLIGILLGSLFFPAHPRALELFDTYQETMQRN